MEHLFDIPYLVTTYGYLGIFVIVFLESGIFFILPGDSLLFTAGLLAPIMHFNIIWLTFLIFLSAFLGGLAGYYIGTRLESLNRYAFFRKIVKPEYINEARGFFDKHGRSALILSRFVPVVRTFLPMVAGIAHMNFSQFIRYSLLGSMIWSMVFTLSGYFLGRAFPQIEHYLFYIIVTIVVLSILPGVWHFIKNKKAKQT